MSDVGELQNVFHRDHTMSVEYRISDGIAIHFEKIEDSENYRKINNQWIVHKLVAKVKNKEVGYLKLSYIPKIRFEEIYPSILNFISERGIHCFPIGKENVHPMDLLPDEQRKIVNRLYLSRMRIFGEMSPHEDSTDSEIQEILREILSPKNKSKNLKKEFQKFHEFRDFHVDKPLVDFIRVEEDFRGKKIALALYLEGSKWMKAKGLNVHMSGVHCSDRPTKIWNSFLENGFARTENGRTFLI